MKGFQKEEVALAVLDDGNVYGMSDKWQGVCCVWSNGRLVAVIGVEAKKELGTKL